MNLTDNSKMTPSKGEHQTPAEFLRNLFLDRKERNPLYSTRALARDLGISQTLLSLVMNEKRPLTIKQATRISLILDLTQDETDLFIRSILRELPESTLAPKKLKSSKHKNFEIERFKTLSRWYHVAILDLTTTKDFVEDSVWIAHRLDISPIEATDALARLIDLGLLERRDNKLIKTDSRIYFATKRSEPAVRKFHKQMITKAMDQLELTDDVSFEARQISSMTMAISKKSWPEAKIRIQKFQQELATFLGKEECDEVYQMNLQMFPLTKTNKNILNYDLGENDEETI